LLVFLLVAQAVAAGAGSGSFLEVHREVSPRAPNGIAWTLTGNGGKAETVYLDREVLLDRSAVANADVVRGPDGMPQIRLGLTPDGARRLTEITSGSVGKRLGIVVADRLRAAPYVTGGMTGGVLVVAGGFSEAEAEELARKLGPPAAGGIPVPPPSGSVSRPRAAAIPDLQGRWRIAEAKLNDRPLQDRKITASSWFFRADELLLTNGEGQTERFAIRPEGKGLLRLEPSAGSSEHGGWIVWKREKDAVVLAFQDNLEGRPDGFAAQPKKIVARLVPRGPR
jgi:hypothetical protein